MLLAHAGSGHTEEELQQEEHTEIPQTTSENTEAKTVSVSASQNTAQQSGIYPFLFGSVLFVLAAVLCIALVRTVLRKNT